MEISRILFPTDFSAGSNAAIPYALDLARRYGAKLYILHVIYDVEREMSWYPAQIRLDEFYREMEDNAAKEFRRCAEEHMEGFDNVEYAHLKGVPSEAILGFVEERGIDLIVMGTHGRKGLDRVFFGSTASRVVRHAPCPVLTVRIPKEKGS